MICSYLVHSDECIDADGALKLYGTARTMDEKVELFVLSIILA